MSENKFHSCTLNNKIIPDDEFIASIENYTPKVNTINKFKYIPHE